MTLNEAKPVGLVVMVVVGPIQRNKYFIKIWLWGKDPHPQGVKGFHLGPGYRPTLGHACSDVVGLREPRKSDGLSD